MDLRCFCYLFEWCPWFCEGSPIKPGPAISWDWRGISYSENHSISVYSTCNALLEPLFSLKRNWYWIANNTTRVMSRNSPCKEQVLRSTLVRAYWSLPCLNMLYYHQYHEILTCHTWNFDSCLCRRYLWKYINFSFPHSIPQFLRFHYPWKSEGKKPLL